MYTRTHALAHDTLLLQEFMYSSGCVLLLLRSGPFPTFPSLLFHLEGPAGVGAAWARCLRPSSSYKLPASAPACLGLSLQQKDWLQVPISHLRQASLWPAQIEGRKPQATSPGDCSLYQGTELQPGQRFLCGGKLPSQPQLLWLPGAV